jgi:hypothetical protein
VLSLNREIPSDLGVLDGVVAEITATIDRVDRQELLSHNCSARG